jgi:thioesterase domain-containing protein
VARRLRRRVPAGPPAGEPAEPPLFERYYDACLGYVPRPWPGHVVVVWPEAEAPARAGDPTYGWGPLAARVDTVRVPGDHDEIVTRHIERVAAALDAHLA